MPFLFSLLYDLFKVLILLLKSLRLLSIFANLLWMSSNYLFKFKITFLFELFLSFFKKSLHFDLEFV